MVNQPPEENTEPFVMSRQGAVLYEKLLPAGDGDDTTAEDVETGYSRAGSRSWPSRRTVAVWAAAQLLFLLAYTAVLLKVAGPQCRPRLEDMVICECAAGCVYVSGDAHIYWRVKGLAMQDAAPATEALRWESRTFDTAVHQKNVYNNEPSPELDASVERPGWLWVSLRLSLRDVMLDAAVCQTATSRSRPISWAAALTGRPSRCRASPSRRG